MCPIGYSLLPIDYSFLGLSIEDFLEEEEEEEELLARQEAEDAKREEAKAKVRQSRREEAKAIGNSHEGSNSQGNIIT